MPIPSTPPEIVRLFDFAAEIGPRINYLGFHPEYREPWIISFEGSTQNHFAETFDALFDSVRRRSDNRIEALAHEILATEAKLTRLKAEREGTPSLNKAQK